MTLAGSCEPQDLVSALVSRGRDREAMRQRWGIVRLRSRGELAMLAKFCIMLIQAYRLIISPWLPASCRFTPTCSAYAQQAIARHGVWHGAGLTCRRLLKCHPWGPAGFDPVPEKRE